ncbi:MAG: LamG domain-containing protein [Candidatus Heimdallarchaeaceae archaeon]
MPNLIRKSQPFDILPDLADPTLVGSWLNKAVRNTGKDYSVKGNDGIPTDVEWDEVGGIFNGSSSILNVGSDSSIDNVAAWTTEAWIKPDGSGDAYQMIFSQSRKFRRGFMWYQHTDEIIRCYIDMSGTDAQALTNTGAIVPGILNYVLVTFDTLFNLRIYINGKEVSYDTQTQGTGSIIGWAGDDVNIGGNSNFSEDYFKGGIEIVNFYSEAKSDNFAAERYKKAVPDDSLIFSTVGGIDDLSRYKRPITRGGSVVRGANEMSGFDGSTGYLLTSDSDSLKGMAQLCGVAWIYPTAWGNVSNEEKILSKNNAVYEWGLESNNVCDIFINGNRITSGQVDAYLNRWQCAGFSYDSVSTQTILFMNGVPVKSDTGTASGVIASTADPLVIGQRSEGGVSATDLYWNGALSLIDLFANDLKSPAWFKEFYLRTRKYF